MRAARAIICVIALAGALAGCGSGTRPEAGGDQAPAAAPVDPSARAGTPDPAASRSVDPKLQALAGAVILVDPGHNGNDAKHPEIINKPVNAISKWKPCETTGTETNAGYQEAAFNFDVAMRLTRILRSAGARVVLTRTTNKGVGPCLTQRAAIGNQAHADVAISIHADGAPAGAHGFHVLEPIDVHGPSTAILKPSRRLAVDIRDAYRAGTGMPPANYIGTKGINPRGDMGGLNLSTVPKVMLECGNMRNVGDAAKLTSAAFRQKIAAAIAAGLSAFLAAS